MKRKVISVIMGGGRGTRLYPLTQERCKPAVPLAGKYRLVDIPISNCLNSGYNRIHILTQFNTASLHNHIQSSYQFDPFGGGFVDILSAEQTERGENWYQGTADAVRQNLHHYGANDEDLFLILSGDQLYRMDLRKIIEHHLETKADVTIAAKPVPKHEVTGLGVMKVNDDYTIGEFVEKPSDPAVVDSLLISDKLRESLTESKDIGDCCLASMGIYVFSKKVMYEALNTDQTDFGKEIIPNMLGKKKLVSFLFDGYWEDIGTVRSFFDANLALTDDVPPFNFFDPDNSVYSRARYLPASKFNNCHLDHVIAAGGGLIDKGRMKRVVIGVRSVVRENCDLENVVIMGADWMESAEDAKRYPLPLGIGRNCKIRNAIIDKNARIGDNVILDPAGKPDQWQEGAVYVRDGVLIVTKKGVVPSGTVVQP
ncbi:glucose-1-phosphate adenylyltransferase [Ruficoccus sp. ZRK36]|uniref:glucose-1-phosphate adenylyltransferase n=1 Tax=Ruficoccus sp. ZRK36 TaxID=2866311 RepID=UPI0021052F2C|nr:glucose-1-phosphate adenylyltransferase [Ruficoccus sp. ZRK36]